MLEQTALPIRRWPADLALAVVFLTRLPLRLSGPLAEDAHARAMGWFPLVGAGVGLFGGAVYGLAALAHLPPLPAALLALGAMVWITGALHEDGAADVADGFAAASSKGSYFNRAIRGRYDCHPLRDEPSRKRAVND